MTKIAAILAVFSVFFAFATSARLVCYYTNWSIYKPDKGKFDVQNVDPRLCTHINYAFAGLNDDGTLKLIGDYEAFGLKQIPGLVDLKKQNADLKVLLSVGGWNEGSVKYSHVAASPTKRAAMVSTVLDFLRKHELDGLDLVWDFPGQRGGNTSADPQNYVTLLGELKQALNANNKMLAVLTAGEIISIKQSYPNIQAVAKNVDMLSLMTYDLHGDFDDYVGHHAPLHASSLDRSALERETNVGAVIEYLLEQGAPASKLNLGIGTYGRGFTLANAKNTSLYAPIAGGSQAGPYTRQVGILGYNEICCYYKNYSYVWDDEQMVPHIINKNQWIGYEDTRSVVEKVKFAKSKDLGGIMIWSLDTDDFGGYCGVGKYPLLTAIKSNL